MGQNGVGVDGQAGSCMGPCMVWCMSGGGGGGVGDVDDV